jgi:hypothetical protein
VATEGGERLKQIMVTHDLLVHAVRCLAVSDLPLRARLDRSSVPLAVVSRRDFETEEELAFYARVELGLTQLRAADRALARDRDASQQDVPIFALEATASHIVDLEKATTRRALLAARGRHRGRSS